MKNIMRFVRQHLNIIIGVLILIFAIVAGIMIKNFFFPNDTKAIYGNSLEGRDKVKITSERIKELKDDMSELTKSVNIRIAGRIIYIDVVAKDDMPQEKAKDVGYSIAKLSDAEKAYYDVQFLINSDTDKDHYPIAGYKHHAKTAISWTRNR